MAQTVYLDTSVIGGEFDDEFKFWTKMFFDQVNEGLFLLAISDLLEGELMGAPEHVNSRFAELQKLETLELKFGPEAETLSQEYINEQIVGHKSLVDCQHIATATVNNIDILVSWNFKHIVNLNKIRLYNAVNLKNGYKPVEIRTPREILK